MIHHPWCSVILGGHCSVARAYQNVKILKQGLKPRLIVWGAADWLWGTKWTSDFSFCIMNPSDLIQVCVNKSSTYWSWEIFICIYAAVICCMKPIEFSDHFCLCRFLYLMFIIWAIYETSCSSQVSLSVVHTEQFCLKLTLYFAHKIVFETRTAKVG